MKVLNELLDEYKVTIEFKDAIKVDYREQIENVLDDAFSGYTRSCRYGGSLAKGTANINSCDIDILYYLHSDTDLTLQEIYSTAIKALSEYYNLEAKNSAITLKGEKNKKNWDMSVDVVPGRFINHSKEDVNLWCNRTKSSLKTNPDKQIKKIRESEAKDVIRLIKLYREFNNFKFKSFFLEIFTVDIVEANFDINDNLVDKLIKFCNCWDQIGKTTIHDPANSNNNIMDIHADYEFEKIREMIFKLRDALLTDDPETIRKCILGEAYDIDKAYKNVAMSHSNLIKFFSGSAGFTVHGYYYEDEIERKFDSNKIVKKQVKLTFAIVVPKSIPIRDVSWIVCNSGYEAKKAGQLRGKVRESSNIKKSLKSKPSYIFIKNEHTSYYGNHFVQVHIVTSNNTIYSDIFTVRIRD
ncbi:MAG: nucleotide-binding domain-containing protein [Bacilli bacterium]|jgi:hypothetical protein